MAFLIQPILSNQDKQFFHETEYFTSSENGLLSKADSELEARRLFRQDLKNFISSKKDHIVYIARTDSGSHAGLIWLADRGHQEAWDLSPEPAWVYDICVLPQYRRKGLARKLITKGEQWAVDRGYLNLGLHVFGENSPAIALYKSTGFETNQVYMQKDLNRRPEHSHSHQFDLIPAAPDRYKNHSYQKFARIALSTGKCPPEGLQARFKHYLSQYGFYRGSHLLMDVLKPGGTLTGRSWFYKNKGDLGETEYVWVQEILGEDIQNRLDIYAAIESWGRKKGAQAIRTPLHIREKDLINSLVKNNYFISNLFMKKQLVKGFERN
jgi:ribosomal protein S18 acetylase RimI-like enzyme